MIMFDDFLCSCFCLNFFFESYLCVLDYGLLSVYTH